MKVYLFSYPEFFKGEVSAITALMERYVFTFHLRKPMANEKEYREFLEALPKQFHRRVMLHGAYGLMKEYKLKGLHFSAATRDEAAFMPEQLCKSTSCHAITEIEELKESFNHLFISPIFPSISKKGYVGKLNLQTVSHFVKNSLDLNVVALGGIDVSRVAQIQEMGFQSLALLGAIWEPENLNVKHILKNYREIEKCLNKGLIV